MRKRFLFGMMILAGLCLATSVEARQWKNTEGKVVTAHYLTSDKDKVTLIVVDKRNKFIKEITLNKSLFSAGDQEYIAQQEVLLTIPAYDEMGIQRGKIDKEQAKKWQFKL